MKLIALLVFLLCRYFVNADSTLKHEAHRRLVGAFDFFNGKWRWVVNSKEDLVPETTSLGQNCDENTECGDGSYCAAGTCLENGKCSTDFDCMNEKNMYPVIECIGALTCDDNGDCGRTCGPVCPDGIDEVDCRVDPCSNTDDICESSSIESCVNYNCGGCSAVVFDSVGKHDQCEWPSCSNDRDCEMGYYCSVGSCREYGTCGDVVDCQNPANEFDVIQCVGPLVCEAGQCGRTCANTTCPDDQEPVNCFASPCDVLDCADNYVSCVDDYCHGCHAIAFDPSGTLVCTSPTAPIEQGSSNKTACSSTDDCDNDFYCLEGECKENGKCVKDLDCKNPNNTFPIAACVGYTYCDDSGRCGIECGASFCPVGVNETDCSETGPSCADISCEEEYEICIDDNCGGCNVRLLDSAGFEVNCATVAIKQASSNKTACSSTDDCDNDFYCLEGECQENGKCVKDLDCKNPNNIFPLAACVGYTYCDDSGRCGIECGARFCPVGVPETDCTETGPSCADISCEEEYEICIDDNCGGCNARLLDSAGFEVNCTAQP